MTKKQIKAIMDMNIDKNIIKDNDGLVVSIGAGGVMAYFFKDKIDDMNTIIYSDDSNRYYYDAAMNRYKVSITGDGYLIDNNPKSVLECVKQRSIKDGDKKIIDFSAIVRGREIRGWFNSDYIKKAVESCGRNASCYLCDYEGRGAIFVVEPNDEMKFDLYDGEVHAIVLPIKRLERN